MGLLYYSKGHDRERDYETSGDNCLPQVDRFNRTLNGKPNALGYEEYSKFFDNRTY